MTTLPDQVEQFEQALTPDAYQAAWRYACRLAGNRQDAEDLLQDALVRALKGFPQLRDPGSFKAWLLCIVRTSYLILLRRRSTGIAAITGRLDGAEATFVDMSAVSDAGPLTEELKAALQRLPAAQRELVALFYFEGLSLKETAQVVGCSPNAVTQRLHRARAALRGMLAQEGYVAGSGCHARGDL